MVVVGTLFSPTGFCLLSLPFVFMLGFGGLAICGVSLLWRPRWPRIVGLIIGVLCARGGFACLPGEP